MIRPLKDKVLIRHLKPQSASAIILTDKNHEPLTTGIVENVGSTTSQVQIGDTVIFPTHLGQYLERDNVEYTILPESAIEAITMRDGF